MNNKLGAEAAPLVGLNRKMPGPEGGHSTLFQQYISPTSLWGRGGKMSSILTHFSQSSLPRSGLAQGVPSHLVTSVSETLMRVFIHGGHPAHQNSRDSHLTDKKNSSQRYVPKQYTSHSRASQTRKHIPVLPQMGEQTLPCFPSLGRLRRWESTMR